jgi:hypothetical protein
LIVSGRATGQEAVLHRGLKTLRWLTEQQTTERATCGRSAATASITVAAHAPTSTSSRSRPRPRSRPVSKPIGQPRIVRWYEQAQHAFDWFIGGNDLGLELYVPETGGCRDGLHMDRVNGNQGAESTLAFLLSLVEMRQAQNMLTSFSSRSPRRITLPIASEAKARSRNQSARKLCRTRFGLSGLSSAPSRNKKWDPEWAMGLHWQFL